MCRCALCVYDTNGEAVTRDSDEHYRIWRRAKATSSRWLAVSQGFDAPCKDLQPALPRRSTHVSVNP
jgi:hypothetical protein